jgi:hypothetical protein
MKGLFNGLTSQDATREQNAKQGETHVLLAALLVNTYKWQEELISNA